MSLTVFQRLLSENPALSRSEQGDADAFKQRHNISENHSIIGLLAGSRRSELKNVAPVLESAAAQLCEVDSNRIVVCMVAESVAEDMKKRSENWSFPHKLIMKDSEKADAFASMKVALACSGTVTTEVALQRTPMIIGYKVGWITWAIARAFLMKSKYITLFNVAADQEVAPELVQTRFTARRFVEHAERLLGDENLRQSQINAQNIALDRMGRGMPPAADISAETILQLVEVN